MKFVSKEIIEIEHVIEILDESGFLVDGGLDGYYEDDPDSDDNVKEYIKDFIDMFDIKSGSIKYDRNNLILDVVLNNNVKLYLHEYGEYGDWGGPYTPKMKMVKLEKNGVNVLENYVNICKQIDPEDYINTPINWWIREYGWEKLLN